MSLEFETSHILKKKERNQLNISHFKKKKKEINSLEKEINASIL